MSLIQLFSYESEATASDKNQIRYVTIGKAGVGEASTQPYTERVPKNPERVAELVRVIQFTMHSQKWAQLTDVRLNSAQILLCWQVINLGLSLGSEDLNSSKCETLVDSINWLNYFERSTLGKDHCDFVFGDSSFILEHWAQDWLSAICDARGAPNDWYDEDTWGAIIDTTMMGLRFAFQDQDVSEFLPLPTDYPEET